MGNRSSKKASQNNDGDRDDSEAVTDSSASKLSSIGLAAYHVLRMKHSQHHKKLWNITAGELDKQIHVTPKGIFQKDGTDPDPTGNELHDEWFPNKIGEAITNTEEWCDIMSLMPPDGEFMNCVKKGLADLCNRDVVINKIKIRMIFGNILGMPIDCNKLMEEIIKDLPEGAGDKISIWVGSWRKGTSWNHAKIIACDGKFLWTGGHNWWDPHYLRNDPVIDISLQLYGPCAKDAHYFANRQWDYIQRKQSTCWGTFTDKCIKDSIELPHKWRVAVTEFPSSASTFPPSYQSGHAPEFKNARHLKMTGRQLDLVPIITLGRQGTLDKIDRPSDDAFVAMIGAARKFVRFSLQDLGPLKMPGIKKCLPGLSWPKNYLVALAKAMWENNVQVELVLSNPHSVPGSLGVLDGEYGFGWSCVDVAAEIIKRVRKVYREEATDEKLRKIISNNLRVCYVRNARGGKQYKDTGVTVGLHAKHFIVDDKAAYIGSQNMYMSDLAEWGVVLDDETSVKHIKKEFWDPMWKVSYQKGEDCDVDDVMDGLNINRGEAQKSELTKEQLQEVEHKYVRASCIVPENSPFYTHNAQEEKRRRIIQKIDNFGLVGQEKMDKARQSIFPSKGPIQINESEYGGYDSSVKSEN